MTHIMDEAYEKWYLECYQYIRTKFLQVSGPAVRIAELV